MIDERPRSYLKIADAKKLLNTQNTSSSFEDKLLDLILEASRLLETETNRRFDRRFETVRRSARAAGNGGDVYDSNVLEAGDDLQAVSSITNGDGVAIDLDDIELRRSRGAAFYSGIALLTNSIQWASDPNNLRRSPIAINGIWGYGGRWRAVTTLSATITDSATSIAVGAITGLEQELLIKVGDELMIVEITPTASPITVERGVNGSTATAHNIGATLYEFEPDYVARRFIKRIVQWYSELDKSPLYGTVQVGDISAPIDITAIPKDAAQILKALTRPLSIGNQS